MAVVAVLGGSLDLVSLLSSGDYGAGCWVLGGGGGGGGGGCGGGGSGGGRCGRDGRGGG